MFLARPAFGIAFAFMLGSLAARYFPPLLEWVWMGWLVVLPPAVLFFLPKRIPAIEAPERLPAEYIPLILPMPGWIARGGSALFILAISVAALFLGAYRQAGWSARLEADRARVPEGFFDATLVAASPMRDHPGQKGRWRIQAEILSVNGEGIPRTPVRLSGPEGPTFRRGDMIRARMRRETLHPPAFPGAFDVSSWMERDGVAVSLAVVRPPAGKKEKPAYEVIPVSSVPLTTGIRRIVDTIRAGAIERTLRYGGDRADGMLAAMLFGYREEMGNELRDVFRRVGIGHVLAISGLHVMLVVGLFWRAGSWLGLSSRLRAVAALALAALYLGLSGGQVAAMRATTMSFVHLGGVALGRKSDMFNSLALAALLITAFNPSAPTDVSFQLSFTAVVFIHLAVRGRRNHSRPGRFLEPRPRRGRFANASARAWREIEVLGRVGVATWIGLFPIVMTVFHQVNIIGLALNIVVIPWMSLVLAGGLLLPFLGWLPGAPAILTFPTRILSFLAESSDRIPYSSLSCHAPAGEWLVVFYLAALAILLLPPNRGTMTRMRRSARAAGRWAMAASAVGMVFSTQSLPPPPEGRIGLLPSYSRDQVIVESPTGEITLIGKPTRGGLREANWLHYLRRSGQVVVVDVSPTDTPLDYSALDFHFGVARTLAVNSGVPDGEASPRSGVWTEIAESGGVRLALGRNRSGQVIWLAVECGKQSATVTERVTTGQISWRLRRGFAGADPRVLVLSRWERAPPSEELLPLFGKTPVAVRGSPAWLLPPHWLSRDRYGALVVAGEQGSVYAYDGKMFIGLPGWTPQPAMEKR
ncbi:MAG: ComEC/Rec2 family competence protein [Planctomycetota bacterium]|jgi:ComEC/Rec2-related protein|nr:ComEC/Rec2 family competence protein [Planctomycetota bacterium]